VNNHQNQLDRFREAANRAAPPASTVIFEMIAVIEGMGKQNLSVPDVLFDGFAVLQAMDEKAKTRTSAENVNDVLGTIVRLLRHDKEFQRDEWEKFEQMEKHGKLVPDGWRTELNQIAVTLDHDGDEHGCAARILELIKSDPFDRPRSTGEKTMSELNKSALELANFLDDLGGEGGGVVRDLVAENERMAKDVSFWKCRYEMLRDHTAPIDLAPSMGIVCPIEGHCPTWIDESVDAAIDAMREGGAE
jgi:hypothetical protein